MLEREGYLRLIENIRNTERISLDEYIEKHLLPLKNENNFFIETLYKDINYILTDVDCPGDNDLFLNENGEMEFDGDDIKLTGYQTRLHDICNWLHMEMLEKFAKTIKYPEEIIDRLAKFEEYLEKETYTPEYKERLDKIKKSIKTERKQNYSDIKRSKFSRLLDIDNFNLKPNIYGFGIDLNKIIERLRK